MLRVSCIRKIHGRKRLTGGICSGKSRFSAGGRELMDPEQKMQMDGEQAAAGARALTSAATRWIH